MRIQPGEKCPTCGGEMAADKVKEVLRCGMDAISVEVVAGVCHFCGDQLYDMETCREISRVRKMLKDRDMDAIVSLSDTPEMRIVFRVINTAPCGGVRETPFVKRG